MSGGARFEWPEGGSIVQHSIPEANAEPWSIASDPQGNLWFVEQGTNQLGEYNPAAGTFAQFQIPTNHSTPDAVAVDSRGDVWFTELTANKLGELAAGSSAIVEFGVPGIAVSLGSTSQTVSCGPGAVMADPSGSIWVACLFSNQLDQFIPAQGAFNSFDLPIFQSAPAGMALDGKGNLWFTAADANMLGEAVVSQLRNGTSQGITEFAPLNQTYVFKLSHPTSFTGSTEVVSTSLPFPSGIAIDQKGGLWVTEHIDSSFDRYNVATKSLVKYWTTQTFGANGYSVTFPNGIAIDPSGAVWIGEHYGNRVAEFLPSSGAMTEYPVPCCKSAIAGVYSVALAPDGRLWFVEIGGNAIGEMSPAQGSSRLSLNVPASSYSLGTQGKITVPLKFAQEGGNSTVLSLSVSGVTGTGSLQNMTADFGGSTLAVQPGGLAESNMTLTLDGLNPGSYYLTLGATTQAGVIYSAILKLTVASGGSSQLWLLISLAAVSAVVAGVGGLVLARRSRGAARRTRSLRDPRRRTRTSAATARPTAA
ncbi:MAG: hypothetical protein KGI26_02420 [Thaumarchaeota archaeon]|nr:hypothetical protein [Nitrososphaerota archaeon]